MTLELNASGSNVKSFLMNASAEFGELNQTDVDSVTDNVTKAVLNARTTMELHERYLRNRPSLKDNLNFWRCACW